MKTHIYLLISLFVASSTTPALSQKLISNSSLTGVCYAGNKINRIYIHPPDDFYKKAGPEGRARITVLYSGFSTQARTAVAYAASILESVLPADTKITISASWELITTAGVLGNSSITGYAGGWNIDAQNPLALYPVALAEKIGGESLNDSLESDITLRINNKINWYLGTDGNTPIARYDLVTIVLHELCHGLGFYDSMDTDNTIGWYGLDSIPLIYDTYIENFSGKRLTDTLAFTNYSEQLQKEYTGLNLYFNGPLLKTYTSGSRARIYAPAAWSPGSSLSHLDEAQTLEPNTLMTPFIDMGEAIHDPGKLTLSILGDLGWINTRIIHKSSHDTEGHLNELPLSVQIASDTTYNHQMVGAVYSYDKFATSDTLLMISPGSDNLYNCTIPVPSYNSEIQYYFYTEDYFKRLYRSPALIDSSRYTVYIGTDTTHPVISHTPLTSLLETVDTIKLNATATDNMGIDTVYAEYKVNEGQSVFIGLTAGVDNKYSLIINARSLLLNGGDSIQYRIFALDSAKVHNSAVLPKSGYFSVHIEDISSVLETYSTDFTGDAPADFINSGFKIDRPSGFNHYGLNSLHPYESSGDNAITIDYFSILRHPLKLNESGLVVSFNEIVLVEPGADGSVFGSEDFFDYVILEGSKNFGKTWFSLADGYDSRFYKPWETAYNSSTVGDNSTTTGNESMLHKHSIFFGPSGKISAGDTLLLRFRLYSDPLANGWGWVVEDLNIYPLVDAVEKITDATGIKIYPNPGRGTIRITTETTGADNLKPMKYNIFNTSGVCIQSNYLPGDIENVIDISDFPSGIYIIVLNRDDWIRAIKYSLIK
jgi:hypothetical protein